MHILMSSLDHRLQIDINMTHLRDVIRYKALKTKMLNMWTLLEGTVALQA
jgi:hypothetical protein